MSKSASRARLAEIIRKRSFGRGEITLASGRKSDFYFNLKPTMLDPEGATLLAELTFEALKAVEAVRDAGGEIALVFTMVDREEGAEETFAQAGLVFRSLYKASEFLKD